MATFYRGNCKECGVITGYFDLPMADHLCVGCFQKRPTSEVVMVTPGLFKECLKAFDTHKSDGLG